jgi:hypothetical protein
MKCLRYLFSDFWNWSRLCFEWFRSWCFLYIEKENALHSQPCTVIWIILNNFYKSSRRRLYVEPVLVLIYTLDWNVWKLYAWYFKNLIVNIFIESIKIPCPISRFARDTTTWKITSRTSTFRAKPLRQEVSS